MELVLEPAVIDPRETRVRGGVRLERDPLRLPALDVAPGEVREPPTAVRDIPPIEPAGVVGDHETHACKLEVSKHRKGVITEPAVRVVERDEDLPGGSTAFATHARREFTQRDPAPTAVRQR